jgi:ketosteroid isomerase-like protein
MTTTSAEQGQASKAVLEGMFEAFESGNVEEAFGFVDPEIVITYPPSMPMSGEWRGHEGLASLFEEVQDLWKDRTTTVHEIVAQDDRVIVLLTTEGTVHGRRIVMPIAETYRIRDGKVVEGRPFFFDTHQIADAVAHAESA